MPVRACDLPEAARFMLAAVTRTPVDPAAVAAAVDALMEAGLTPRAARRRVAAVTAPLLRAAEVERVRALLAAEVERVRALLAGPRGPKLRGAVRRKVGVPGSVPVEVEAGHAPPLTRGRPGFTTFKGTHNRVHYPAAAIRAGCRLTYHPDTRVVVVGAGWVLKTLAPTLTKKRAT